MEAESGNHEKQLRIGLVLYGGVSLAIYIYGVVYEFLQFVRRKGHYKDLIDKAGIDPVIDVISGSSAGGINGLFLAKALAGNTLLSPLKKLWIEEADFEKLLDSTSSAPLSLLDSSHYIRMLSDALDTLDASQDMEARKPGDEKGYFGTLLDLFITATDLDGISQTHENPFFSCPFRTKRHNTVFHFKVRPGKYDLIEDRHMDQDFIEKLNAKRTPRDDFKPEASKRKSKNDYLAKVAASSSAFPVAFAPVTFDRDEKKEMQTLFGKNLFQHTADHLSVYGDGGMVDNKPFGYTIDTIFKRQARGPVDRKLFFIEPDPESREDEPRRKLRPDGFDSLIGFLNARMYESIAEDLGRIEGQNDKMLETRRMLDSLQDELDAFIKYTDKSDYRDQFKKSVLYQAYTRLKKDRLVGALTENIALYIEDSNSRHRLIGELEKSSNLPHFFQNFDYPFRIRRIRYFIHRINDVMKKRPNLSEDENQCLMEFKTKLYAYVEYYTHGVWRIWSAAAEKPDTDLEDIEQAYARLMTPDRRDKTLKLISDYLSDPRLKRLLDHLPTRDAFDAFEFLDMHIYPVEVLADIGEADPLDVIRISPKDATRYLDSVSEKLAGEKLMHFSAFLNQSWRENDIIWGRLDAAEVIVKTVLKDDPRSAELFLDRICPDVLREELVSIFARRAADIDRALLSGQEGEELQKILAECMRNLEKKSEGDEAVNPASMSNAEIETYFAENYQIGKQGLEDVPKPYAWRITAKTLRTLGRMLLRLPEKSGETMARIIRKPIRFLERTFNFLYLFIITIGGHKASVRHRITAYVIIGSVVLTILHVFRFIEIKRWEIWAAVLLAAAVWWFKGTIDMRRSKIKKHKS